MRINERMKRALSILLCVMMLVQYVPTHAFAATTDNLCEHHTEHTAECGYVEAAEGSPCTHIHDEACGYAEPIGEVLCACTETDDTGALVHTEGCGYVAPVAEVKCACQPTVTHGGEGCTYVEGKAGSPCTHTHAVKVNSADSCYKLLCSHADGGHDDACGYVAAVEAHECHYECAECAAAAASEEAPEESSNPAPVCTCAEACTTENFNEYCDVCAFDISKCTGTDTAVGYAEGDKVSVTFNGETTYYTSIKDAVAKANESGNATITLL